ncbi:MAG TPA: ABC transporter permease subunit [Anaerolineae bacterium]|nr:ABC transporter permease subunit [Anaerolineae bacterium]
MKTLRVYIITRVLLTIPMLFILVTLVFFIVRIMPGDPVEAMLRPGVPQEYKDQLKHNLGLDRPLFLNFQGSTAQVLPEQLFLQNEAGPGGGKVLLVEQGLVMEISKRIREKEDPDLAGTGDWLQVVVPEDWTGWVSPDQFDWMRQVNTEMTVEAEETIPGTETWTRFAAPEGPAGTEVNAIWGEKSGLLWFGSDRGVTRWSEAAGWEPFEDTADKTITAIWSGRPADLWFATDGAGVLRIKSNKWSSFTTAEGLPSNRVLSVWGKGSKPVWVGTDRGAAVYDGKTWQAVTPADGLAGQEVRAIWGDGKKTFWFGTEAGLSRFDGKAWTTYTAADGLPSDRVLALWGDEAFAKGQGGYLWVGTDAGLARFDGETWTMYTPADGLVDGRIQVIYGEPAFAAGKEGRLWIGTPAGAGSFDGQIWQTYTTDGGLSDNDVRAVWQDNNETLWLGTAGGLNRFDSRPWLKLHVPNGGMVGWAPASQFDVQVRPFDSQYFNYLGDLLRLDLGVSMAPTRGRPVIEDLKLKFPATLELAIASLTVTILIGVPLGALAAHKRRSVTDYTARIFSIVIWAVPVFWLGLMFQLIFGVYLGDWYETSAFAHRYLYPIFHDFLPLPISGRIGTEMAPHHITGLYIVDSILTFDGPALLSALRYMILPAFTLGLYLSGVFVRLTRSNMLDTLQEDFITASRARGIRERSVVYGHALKNAFIPILTMMGLQFAALLAGAVLTETTFSWPGMGLFMWERIGYRDFNSIQGSVVFFALLVAAVSLIVDIIYAWIDPRIRY